MSAYRNSRTPCRLVVILTMASGIALVATIAAAQTAATHRIVDANGDEFLIAEPFTITPLAPGKPTTPPTTPPGVGPAATKVSGYYPDGFTVPAGATWHVDSEVVSGGDITIRGTLVLRPGETITLDTDDRCKTEIEVHGDGRLDAQGSDVTAWTRAPTSIADWSPGDDIRTLAPGYPTWDGGTPAAFHPLVPDYEVVNLTRDVVIRSTTPHCGRVMFHSSVTQPQTIRNVTIDGLGVPDEVGWYPLHFHMLGDASRGSLVDGVVVINAGNHAFVPHASHGITFRNTIAFNVVGDAYWWDNCREGAVENATFDVTYEAAVAADVHPASEGIHTLTGFWLGCGAGGTVTDSVAVGVRGGQNASGFHWPSPSGANEHLWVFENNVAHGNRNGVFVWQNATQFHHHITGLVAYDNDLAGIDHGAYGNSYSYDHVLLVGNGVGAQLHSAARDDATWSCVTERGSTSGVALEILPNPPVITDAPVTFAGDDLAGDVVLVPPRNGSADPIDTRVVFVEADCSR